MLCLGPKKSLSTQRLKQMAQCMAQCTNAHSRVWYHSAIQAPLLNNDMNVFRYICRARRVALAKSLGLSERQIKIWFQVRPYLIFNFRCFFNGPTPATSLLIFGLFYQKIQQINVKNVMTIQYMEPGFEPTTSWTLIISHNY